MYIIADMSHLAGQAYEVSICSLGIMGTKFDRENPIADRIEVSHKSQSSILVEKVRPVYQIGDRVEIRIRVVSSGEIKTSVLDVDEETSQIVLDTWQAPPGEYEVTFESFNTLVSHTTALKTDTITVIVVPKPPSFTESLPLLKELVYDRRA